MKEKIDNNIISIIALLLIIPVIIYLIGFTKIYIAIPTIIIIISSYIKLLKNEKIEKTEILKKKYYYLISFIVITIWVLFSGIGSFSYQNSDYTVRNAVLRDLISYDWPIIFDVTKLSPETLEIIGTNKVGFVYYFTYWLPAALLGKIFGITIANIFLVLQTIIFLMAIVYLMNRFFKKQSYLHLFMLIMFSGLDILGYIDLARIIKFEHIEWWAILIQYSSNTTQLYWVFNQSIPIWLITMLILNMKKSNSILFISPLIFCYSPFSTFGMIPIAIYLVLKKIIEEKETIKNIKRTFLSCEFINAILILIIFGTFYLSADSSIKQNGLIWTVENLSTFQFLYMYISFIYIEILIYFILLKNKYKKSGLFRLIFIELLIIPFYKMTPANDFCMRASIVPLFILMLYWIGYLSEIKKEKKLIRIIAIIIIILSTITPITEIGRSVKNTIILERKEYIEDDIIYSIGNPKTKEGLILCNNQFYNKDYDNNFFSKYIAK